MIHLHNYVSPFIDNFPRRINHHQLNLSPRASSARLRHITPKQNQKNFRNRCLEGLYSFPY